MIKLLFLIGWPICNVCLHAEFVDLQAESKPVIYSNFVDCVRSCINEEFYHANLFARKAQDDWNVGSNGQFSGKSFADTVSSSKGNGNLAGKTGDKPKVTKAFEAEDALGGLKPLSAEQPWVVRPGQEWKTKVLGKAQVTGGGDIIAGKAHAIRSYREAI